MEHKKIKGQIFYSLINNALVLKFINNITWLVSSTLSNFITCSLKNKQISHLYIDLSETTYIDSTILGVFVHFKNARHVTNVETILVAPSKTCDEILSSVGLHKIFLIETSISSNPGIFYELPLDEKLSTEEIAEIIKDAHRDLMNLNDKNKELFSPVVEGFAIPKKE
jgi:anti-anti-sigma factor